MDQKMDTNGTEVVDVKPIDQYQEDLFKSLDANVSVNVNMCYSIALTVETVYRSNLPVLTRLFEFYKQHDQIDMARRLCENILMRNFDFTHDAFDVHLNSFGYNLVRHMANKMGLKLALKYDDVNFNVSDFYWKLFAKFAEPQQEKFLVKLMEKYKTYFSFLKAYSESGLLDKKSQTPAQAPCVDVKEIYVNLAKYKGYLLLMRDLMLVYQRFITDYGLFFIDAFLNMEKHLLANLVQNCANNNSALNVDVSVTSAEKRSLNLMRRICVNEFILEFVYLIDKLDNRHCYRWIEKSLEFFTKYAIAATQVKNSSDDSVEFIYSRVSLLNENELSIGEYKSQEDKETSISFILENLKDLSSYTYKPSENGVTFGANSSPFYNVYNLLEEISKKLDWPNTAMGSSKPQDVEIERKLSYLFELKLKNDKNISMSSLNKQISFFGITYFFHKLIEFQSLCAHSFSDMLILAPTFAPHQKSETSTAISVDVQTTGFTKPIEATLTSLVFCLKLWHKFSQHKEFLTIITKCLNNSKLDGLVCYKGFLADYYNSYLLANSNSINHNWTSLAALSLKQRIATVSYLFIHEKSSFQMFFNEFTKLINETIELKQPVKCKFYGCLTFCKAYFDLFDFNRESLLKYFSKIVNNKLRLMVENKKQQFVNFIGKNDAYLAHILVLLQPCVSTCCNPWLYELVIQVLRSKAAFTFLKFFDYIYDLQILQDFSMILSAQPQPKKFKLADDCGDDIDLLDAKILQQVNREDAFRNFDYYAQFLENNLTDLVVMFDQIAQL